MNLRYLERRQDPRRSTYIPIMMHPHHGESEMPAHLVDLSYGGAGLLTTAYNAPALGQHVDLHFESPNNDGGTEGTHRRETGVIVNLRNPERGIARLGVRFFQRPDLFTESLGPAEPYIWRRPIEDAPAEKGLRRGTARNFDKSKQADNLPIGAGSA